MKQLTSHPRLRVAALLVFSFGVTVRGLGYIDAPNTTLTTFVDAAVPLRVWAFVWIAAGVAILAGIWSRTLARWALSLGASLWGVWALSYVWSWVVGDSQRGWLTAGAMATIAGSMYITAILVDAAPTRRRRLAWSGAQPLA